MSEDPQQNEGGTPVDVGASLSHEVVEEARDAVRGPYIFRKTFEGIANAIYIGGGDRLDVQWSRLTQTRPDLKSLGQVLVLAGVHLNGSDADGPDVMWLASPDIARLSDGSAVRAGASAMPGDGATKPFLLTTLNLSSVLPNLEKLLVPSLDASVLSLLEEWANEDLRMEVKKALAIWLQACSDSSPDSAPREGDKLLLDFIDSRVGAAVLDCLPDVLAHMRTEVASCQRMYELGSQELSSSKVELRIRWRLSLLLSLQWTLQRTHYRALRNLFGACLPLLLQILDGCADSLVRLIGLRALHLLLDRSMAVEAANFAPALEQFMSRTSPMGLERDATWLGILVPPYCACWVLTVLKAYAQHSLDQQAALESFLSFGEVQCGAQSQAFREFLEHGLLPLIHQQPLILGPQLKRILELLIRSTEALNAKEVILSWCGLHALLDGVFAPRLRSYAFDVMLRAAFTYLTFIASEGPSLSQEEGKRGNSAGGFLSPCAAAMSEADWALVVQLRPATAKVVAEVVRMVQRHARDELEAFLQEMAETVDVPPHGSIDKCNAPEVAQHFLKFVAFAKSSMIST